jgi:hypothetical protein
VIGPLLEISGLEEGLDQAQKPVIVEAFPEDGEEELWGNFIEGFANLIPLSTTHSMTIWRS